MNGVYTYEAWNNTLNTTTKTKYPEIVNRSVDFGGVGGAVVIWSSPNINILNSNFTNNAAISTGGAVDLINSNSTILNSNFEANRANWYRGGAVAEEGGNLTIKNSTFLNNRAGYNSGAIFSAWNNTTLNVANSTFKDNFVDYHYCGAICLSWSGGNGYANITTSNFTNNKASQVGRIYVDGDHSLDLTNCNFTNNTQALGTGSTRVNTLNNKISNNGVGIQFIMINKNYTIGDDWRTNNTWTSDNNYTMSITGRNSVYSITYNFTSTITGKNALIFADTGSVNLLDYGISNNTLNGSNAFKGIVDGVAISFDNITSYNTIINCNISGNTDPIIMKGISNRIISSNITGNTNGINIASDATNTTINHNLIYNNGAIDLINTGINTNANLNWWGTNNGSSRVSGITLANCLLLDYMQMLIILLLMLRPM